MATPADERLLELLAKWLKSLELHVRYAALDNDSYGKIQPWPEHQRPSRWIVDLGLQKTRALKKQVEDRIKAGDAQFCDALELMMFLTNLVGSEHIERFIPLADPAHERELVRAAAEPEATAATTVSKEMASVTATREMPVSVTATREMPKFAGSKRTPPRPAPVGTTQVARTERRSGHAKPAAKSAQKSPGKLTVPGRPEAAAPPARERAPPAAPARPPSAPPRGASGQAEAVREEAREQVVADAVRLVQWGRKWFELAELIARMADRPPLPEVRRILKDNKTVIDKKAGRG